MSRPDQPLDEVSSAPESGTVRDETSGNQPSAREPQFKPPSGKRVEGQPDLPKDDPANAGAEG